MSDLAKRWVWVGGGFVVLALALGLAGALMNSQTTSEEVEESVATTSKPEASTGATTEALPPLGTPTPGTATGEPPLGNQAPAGGTPLGAAPTGGGQASIADHETFFATSTDGKTWSVGSSPIATHASVPDLVELSSDVGSFKAGTLLAYFVETSKMSQGAGNERIGMVSSADGGKTWTDTTIVTMNVPKGQLPVDPGILQLEDGSLRLYYFDFSAAQEAVSNPSVEYVFYAASSTNGTNFGDPKEVFRSKTMVTDPEVVTLGSTWYLYLADQAANGIAVASSRDGLSFASPTSTGVQGIPGALVVDGGVQLFGCNGGISRAMSSNGTNYSGESVLIRQPFCDPGPIVRSDGTFAMVLRAL